MAQTNRYFPLEPTAGCMAEIKKSHDWTKPKRIYTAYNKEEAEKAKKEHGKPIVIPHFSCHNLRHTFCTRFCEG